MHFLKLFLSVKNFLRLLDVLLYNNNIFLLLFLLFLLPFPCSPIISTVFMVVRRTKSSYYLPTIPTTYARE